MSPLKCDSGSSAKYSFTTAAISSYDRKRFPVKKFVRFGNIWTSKEPNLGLVFIQQFVFQIFHFTNRIKFWCAGAWSLLKILFSFAIQVLMGTNFLHFLRLLEFLDAKDRIWKDNQVEIRHCPFNRFAQLIWID